MTKSYSELAPSPRTLLGPGPSNVNSRVLRAMSTPLIGHLDPEFLDIMNDSMELLRETFQTKNFLTIPMSATGSAGMETAFVNVLEPGDKAIVCINGLFGQRMADIADRCGAEVIKVEAEWGKIIEPKQVKDALDNNKNVKVVAIVHAETSTGICQPLEEISQMTKENDALFLVDTVTSLGGVELKVDQWGIDVAYSGTQKCLSCPPGLAPVTFSDKAIEALNNRKTKVQSWYLDLSMVQSYWSNERFYHHTAPITMVYALRESLRIIQEEGLENRFERHKINSKALVAGLKAMGLEMYPQEGYRLPSLNAVKIPEGVEDAAVRKALLKDYNLEIGGGLGDNKGKIWRIGLMGESSTRNNVYLVLSALESTLNSLGYKAGDSSISAANEIYKG